jgi:hypothetical protein
MGSGIVAELAVVGHGYPSLGSIWGAVVPI